MSQTFLCCITFGKAFLATFLNRLLLIKSPPTFLKCSLPMLTALLYMTLLLYALLCDYFVHKKRRKSISCHSASKNMTD